jgi:hypothetical protein
MLNIYWVILRIPFDSINKAFFSMRPTKFFDGFDRIFRLIEGYQWIYINSKRSEL